MPEVPKVPTPNEGEPIPGQEYPAQKQEKEESQLSPDYLTSEEQNKILEDFERISEEYRKNPDLKDPLLQALKTVLEMNHITRENNGKEEVLVSEKKYRQVLYLLQGYLQALSQEKGRKEKMPTPDYLSPEEEKDILEDFKNLLEEFRERNLSAEDAFESVLIAH
ncbi:MAG: hypothetical protein QXK26_01405, partial [Candidatus Bathyarchaeia archaeon]